MPVIVNRLTFHHADRFEDSVAKREATVGRIDARLPVHEPLTVQPHEHDYPPFRMRSNGATLTLISSYSSVASESATIAPPAWATTISGVTTSVRITMLVSI